MDIGGDFWSLGTRVVSGSKKITRVPDGYPRTRGSPSPYPSCMLRRDGCKGA